MATFGSVNFRVMTYSPGESDQAEVTEIHIPGGYYNFVDIGGELPTHVDLMLYFPIEADYTSMRAKIATQDTLTWETGTYSNALLTSLRRTYRGRKGQSIVNASFIIP